MIQRPCPNCQRPMNYANEKTLTIAVQYDTKCSACTLQAKWKTDLEVVCHDCHSARSFKDKKKWKRYLQDHVTPESRVCAVCWRKRRRLHAMMDHPVLFLTSLEQRLAEQWSLEVRSRDHHCVACLATSNLQAHHRLQVHRHPFLSLQLDNGMTLCQSCHDSVHGSEPPVNDTVAELRTHLLA